MIDKSLRCEGLLNHPDIRHSSSLHKKYVEGLDRDILRRVVYDSKELAEAFDVLDVLDSPDSWEPKVLLQLIEDNPVFFRYCSSLRIHLINASTDYGEDFKSNTLYKLNRYSGIQWVSELRERYRKINNGNWDSLRRSRRNGINMAGGDLRKHNSNTFNGLVMDLRTCMYRGLPFKTGSLEYKPLERCLYVHGHKSVEVNVVDGRIKAIHLPKVYDPFLAVVCREIFNLGLYKRRGKIYLLTQPLSNMANPNGTIRRSVSNGPIVTDLMTEIDSLIEVPGTGSVRRHLPPLNLILKHLKEEDLSEVIPGVYLENGQSVYLGGYPGTEWDMSHIVDLFILGIGRDPSTECLHPFIFKNFTDNTFWMLSSSRIPSSIGIHSEIFSYYRKNIDHQYNLVARAS